MKIWNGLQPKNCVEWAASQELRGNGCILRIACENWNGLQPKKCVEMAASVGAFARLKCVGTHELRSQVSENSSFFWKFGEFMKVQQGCAPKLRFEMGCNPRTAAIIGQQPKNCDDKHSLRSSTPQERPGPAQVAEVVVKLQVNLVIRMYQRNLVIRLYHSVLCENSSYLRRAMLIQYLEKSLLSRNIPHSRFRAKIHWHEVQSWFDLFLGRHSVELQISIMHWFVFRPIYDGRD